MQLKVDVNLPEIQRALDGLAKNARSAVREGINRTLDWVETDVRLEMRRVFDRPVPFTLKSLRKYYANTTNLAGVVWFRQRSREDDKLWAVPQIKGGSRQAKPFEVRLQQAGILPRGWYAVPGGAAPVDSYGNMSRGEISRILNVLGTFRESGFNKADSRTRARLRKGNAKRNVYGFAYWVNPVNGGNRHIPPGIYRRVYTGFGTSLQPMLVFVRAVSYRPRLHFFEVTKRTVARRFPAEFAKALDSLERTGSASGARRAR